MSEFLTWKLLATMGGATIATTAIVQFLKFKLDKVGKIPTRLIVYIIAAVILSVAQIFAVGFSLNNLLLGLVNAVFVAAAAMGTYEVAVKKIETEMLKK